jgi:hypothetical protein
MTKEKSIKQLMAIPGIGKSIANDLWNIGITSVADLKDKETEVLYDLSNKYAGAVQDRCLLYSFRCAVYYAQTAEELRESYPPIRSRSSTSGALPFHPWQPSPQLIFWWLYLIRKRSSL